MDTESKMRHMGKSHGAKNVSHIMATHTFIHATWMHAQQMPSAYTQILKIQSENFA